MSASTQRKEIIKITDAFIHGSAGLELLASIGHVAYSYEAGNL
jgi:hypothetical protein